MAQMPWRHWLEAGTSFTELQRSQARKIVSDLVAQGQLAREQAAGVVDELVALSRRRTEELAAFVASEVQRQIRALGIATQDDLRRLERRLAGGARKAPAKKARAKKAPARKAAATKRPANAAGRGA